MKTKQLAIFSAKSLTRILLSAAIVTLLLATGSANAGKPSSVTPPLNCSNINTDDSNSCNTELFNLCMVINEADSLGNRDRDTMMSKAIGADIKLEQDKPDDAHAKLLRIENKLDSLINAPKTKISTDDADNISGSLINSHMCVDYLDS